MTNSHAENAQDGQDRPDASDALGTADAPAAPQASDARGGGQDGPRAGQDAPGGQYDYGSGHGDQSVGGDSGAGDVAADAAGTGAGQGGDEAGQVGAGAPGDQAAQDEGTRRLAKAVLAAEQALIEFEIAVETFRVEVENFSRLHHQRLGPMYARLDELDAQIAEAVAARTGAPEDIRKAQEARASVLPMPDVEELFHGWIGSDGLFPESQAMLTEQPVQPPQKVRPSEEARKVYRDLVRKAHPDLARDDAERARRDEFIARVNAAYGRGDEATLRELVREWEAGPAPVEERLSESEELYARLEWLAERKELLAAVAAELEDSAIGAMIKMAPQDPDALLEEIAEKLLADVAEREAYLAQLVG
ncbi:J domain-containing protein [Streptomyces sp. Pv4-95]|uniref:J domain-containing protein n=1 Tax=Streptomyces sp. Pv4-95 TaxID=3049543 RepID=UPI0038928B9F